MVLVYSSKIIDITNNCNALCVVNGNHCRCCNTCLYKINISLNKRLKLLYSSKFIDMTNHYTVCVLVTSLILLMAIVALAVLSLL